mgnify:CR=1 FL=1
MSRDGQVTEESGTITVEVRRTNFPKAKGEFRGFAIVKCTLDADQDGDVPVWLRRLADFGVKGQFPAYPQAGDLYDIHFTRYERNKWGITLDAKDVRICARRNERSVRALLKQMPQIGAFRAREIFKLAGGSLEGVLDMLDNNPEGLAAVDGITAERAHEVSRWWTAHSAIRGSWVFLASAGVSPLYVGPLMRAFGARAQTVLTDNPYVGMRVAPFRVCDGIAKHLGIEDTDPRRIVAAAVCLLEKTCNDLGYTWVNKDEILGKVRDTRRNAATLRDMGVTEDLLVQGLEKGQDATTVAGRDEGPFIAQEGSLYSLATLCDAERCVAERLIGMLSA